MPYKDRAKRLASLRARRQRNREAWLVQYDHRCIDCDAREGDIDQDGLKVKLFADHENPAEKRGRGARTFTMRHTMRFVVGIRTTTFSAAAMRFGYPSSRSADRDAGFATSGKVRMSLGRERRGEMT